MRFSFVVTSAGWANIELCSTSGPTARPIPVSYVSDALGEFVRAVADICLRDQPMASIKWQQEPAIVFCTLSRRGGNSAVEIVLEWAPDARTIPTLHYKISASVDELAQVVVAGCNEIDREYYAQEWPNQPFPEREVRELGEATFNNL